MIESCDLSFYICSDLIAESPFTGNGRIKNPSEVAGLFNCATFFQMCEVCFWFYQEIVMCSL